MVNIIIMELKGCYIFILVFLFQSCSVSITSMLSKAPSGRAIIQSSKGSFSPIMGLEEAFEMLQNNETLYISSGKVELTSVIIVSNLKNVKIIGNNTALVALLDIPVLQFKNVTKVQLSKILVVHEIGEWCSQNCVEFYDASDLIIRDVNFDGSGYFGLSLVRVTNAIIENNEFYNCTYGLSSWDSANLRVFNNKFYKNRKADIMDSDPGQFINDFTKDNVFERKP